MAGERGDLMLGFVLTMDEVAERAEALRDAAVALSGPSPGAALLPLEALAAAGYAVHAFRAPLPGNPQGRCALVGWSLVPAPVDAVAPVAPVDRARLVEAEGRVRRLLDLLKLDRSVGYHLVVASSGAPADLAASPPPRDAERV